MIPSAPHRARQVAFAKDVVIQVIGGDALVLNLRDETVFSLNPTGARIAQLISTPTRVDAVVDALCLEYGAEREDLARDVDDLVDALVSRGLVVVISGGETA